MYSIDKTLKPLEMIKIKPKMVLSNINWKISFHSINKNQQRNNKVSMEIFSDNKKK